MNELSREQATAIAENLHFLERSGSQASLDIATRLITVGTMLSREKDLFKLLRLIVDEARGLTSAVAGTIYLVDNQKKEIKFFATDQDSFKEIVMPLTPSSIAGYVGCTGETLNIEDVYLIPVESEYQFNDSFDKKTGFRTKSMLVLPLKSHHQENIGVLQMINKKSNSESSEVAGNNRAAGDNPEIEIFSDWDLEIIQALGSQAAVCIENAILYREIENLFNAFVQYSATAIDARDPATGGHSRRVAAYSVALAKAMGCFTPQQIKEVYYAAWLHDIGKIGVPEAVLTKANKLNAAELETIRIRFNLIKSCLETDFYRKLADSSQTRPSSDEIAVLTAELNDRKSALDQSVTFIEKINVPAFLSPEDLDRLNELKNSRYRYPNTGEEIEYLTENEFNNLKVVKGNLRPEEMKIMQSHADHTYEILKQVPFTRELKDVPEYAGRHHEKLDGSGYPQGLTYQDLPLQVRILSLTDIFDALAAQDRPYKKAMPVEKALNILRFEVKDGKLDPEIFRVFEEHKIYLVPDPLEKNFSY